MGLAATSAALLGSQFGRIFSGLTTAPNCICQYFAFYRRDYQGVLIIKKRIARFG
jgi:hypothetical protein